MPEALAVLAQYALPKQAITRFAGVVAGWRGGAATTAIVRWFIGKYGVDMGQAVQPDPAAYATFNDFFTRALRPGARPLAPRGLLCPVDGAISQFGRVEAGRIFQAKGHDYTAAELLGGDAARAAPFAGGHFATLYLSPKDYHRVHMPCAGRLVEMLHVPGDLFSVNPATARGVPRLFARNERVVCIFDDPAAPGDDASGRAGGRWALVLVGATIVGSMATVWHGTVNPPRPGRVRRWDYAGDTAVDLPRGAEMGRFLLGSTVVLLFPPGPLRFDAAWAAGADVRMGQAMALRGG